MEMLFSIPPKFPAGFTYVPDFLTIEEEENLLREVLRIPLHTFLFQGFEAKRKVASFGYDYSFERRDISKGTEIPDEFHWLIKKVKLISGANGNFEELLITEYPVGSVINWHRDAPPFENDRGNHLAVRLRLSYEATRQKPTRKEVNHLL